MRPRRVAAVAVLAVAGAGAAVLPALGASQSVDATVFNRFSQPSVTIAVGESVTWHNRGGDHNVVFDDGSYTNGEPSSANWTATHTFTTPGVYTYHCQIHQASGMIGTVTVEGTGTTPPPTTTPTPTTPTPKPTPKPRRHHRRQAGSSHHRRPHTPKPAR